MTSGTTKTDTKPVQKRQDFRVATSLELRLRPSGSSSAAAGPDPVALFEDLSLAQTRFRKELGPAGRAFIDKLMTTIDALAGIAAAAQGDDGWSDPIQGQADLSAGGLGFVVPDPLPVSSEYELEFSLQELINKQDIIAAIAAHPSLPRTVAKGIASPAATTAGATATKVNC